MRFICDLYAIYMGFIWDLMGFNGILTGFNGFVGFNGDAEGFYPTKMGISCENYL